MAKLLSAGGRRTRRDTAAPAAAPVVGSERSAVSHHAVERADVPEISVPKIEEAFELKPSVPQEVDGKTVAPRPQAVGTQTNPGAVKQFTPQSGSHDKHGKNKKNRMQAKGLDSLPEFREKLKGNNGSDSTPTK